MTRRIRAEGEKKFLRPRGPINLSHGAFHHLAAALGVTALLGASALCRADWTLTSADFQEQPHLTINTWTAADGLSATSQSGNLITIPSRDVLSLASTDKTPSRRAANRWKILLRNGDLLYGQAGGTSGKSLLFTVAEFGRIPIPLKNIATLSAPVVASSAREKPRKLPLAGDHDIILFKEGDDRLEGLFAGIDNTQLQFLTDGADAPANIALSKVDTIVFGGVQPARTIPPLSLRLTFAPSGSVLTIPLDSQSNFSWTLNKITFKDAAGQAHSADAAQVSTAELLGGRVVYLSELAPEREDQISFLGTPWPFQLNKNVLGQPLTVGRNTYPRGIGVHTQSTLVYTLDGSFDTLSLRVGLDDSAAPNGEARASIVLDGKTLWQNAALKPGELSPLLSLPITGGHHLELRADPTARLDVQGRVDWINAALQRK